MKRSLLVLTLCLLICTSAKAAVTVEQVTEPDYVINNGYSEATAEQVLIMKNRVDGKPAEPLYQKKNNKFVNLFKDAYGYLDPASDTTEFYHHDIHKSPSWRDL